MNMKTTHTSLAQISLLAVAFVTLIIMLPATLAAPLPDLQVSLLRYEPSPVQPGQTIDLWIEVANEGNPTTDAWLELVDEDPFTILPSQDRERARTLGVVSGTQQLQFRVRIDEDADDGNIPLRVRYGASRATGVSQEVQFDISIQTFDARIGVEAVKQEPALLAPGEQGKISVTLTNHDDRSLKNIDVQFDLTNSYDSASNMNNMIAMQAMINARLEDVSRRIASGLSPLAGVTPMMSGSSGGSGGPAPLAFTAVAPVGTSTLLRVDSLMPGESRTIALDVQALPDAPTGIHAVALYINYNDDDNNPFHVRTEIPITIDMAPDLLLQMKSSSLRSTDFEGTVTLLVANRGLSDLRFVSVELLGDESYRLLTAPSESYLGTLTPGMSVEAEFSLLPEADKLELPVSVTFRDAFNNPVTHEQTLTLEIVNRNYYRDMPYEMMLPWVILGLVVLALTGYYFWSLKK